MAFSLSPSICSLACSSCEPAISSSPDRNLDNAAAIRCLRLGRFLSTAIWLAFSKSSAAFWLDSVESERSPSWCRVLSSATSSKLRLDR